jgi:type II secretion system protein N
VKERVIKLAKDYGSYLAYPVFYLIAFVVCTSLTFPYSVLKRRIVASFNDAQRSSGGMREIQIASVSGYFLTGVRMKGVTVTSASTEAGKAPTKMTIDEATVRYAVLPALFGGSRVDFTVHAFGGVATGSYSTSDDERSLEVSLESIDLAKVSPLAGLLGAPVDGKLGGSAHFRMPGGRFAKASGQVALEAKGLAVGDGKAKVMDVLPMPRAEVGTLALTADAKDGALRITKFGATGKDIDVSGDGRVMLRDEPVDSKADLTLKYRISDGYRGRSDITKSIFGAPGTVGQGLIDLDPKSRQAKRADGFFAWAVSGPLSHPDFIPAVAATK